MILQVLLLFVVKCSSITLEFRHVTKPLSWSDAFVSGLCTTSHYVTGYVAPDSVHADITVKDIPEAWVGLYGISTQFLNFDGCFMFEENALNDEKVHKKSFKDGEDLIGSCYLFCNESLFGLSMDTCYCLATIRLRSSGLCNVNAYTGIWFCTSPGGGLCGGGMIQQTGLRCLCLYRSVGVNRDFNIRVPGDCVSYDVRGSVTRLANCDAPKYFVCTETTTQRRDLFSNLQYTWRDAALLCQSSAYAFGNRSSVIRHVESPNSSIVDSFWTNKFRKQFYSFVSPGKDVQYVQCVAVRNESGEFKFVLRDCLHILPALCFSVNPEVTLPIHESTSAQVSLHDLDISVGFTTIGHDDTSSSGTARLAYAVETSSVWPVVFVTLGIIVIIITLLVMCYRKRSRNTLATSLKSDKIVMLPKPEVDKSAIANTGEASQAPTVPKGDILLVAPTDTQLYTTLAPTDRDIPAHAYMELTPTDTQQYTSLAPASRATTEHAYMELDESKATKVAIHEQSSNLRVQPEAVVVSSNNTTPYREDDSQSGTVSTFCKREDSMSASDETYNKLHESDATLETVYDHTGNPDGIYDEIAGDVRKSKAPDDVIYDVVT